MQMNEYILDKKASKECGGVVLKQISLCTFISKGNGIFRVVIRQ